MSDIEAFYKMRCLACGAEGGVTETPNDFASIGIWTAPFTHVCEDEPRVTGRVVVVASAQYSFSMNPGDISFRVGHPRYCDGGKTLAEVYVMTRVLRWSDFPERAAKRCESLDDAARRKGKTQ